MTVGSSEAFLTLAAEMAAGEATALTMRTAHVGRDVAYVARGAVRNHGDRTAVNHCERETHGRGLAWSDFSLATNQGEIPTRASPCFFLYTFLFFFFLKTHYLCCVLSFKPSERV